MTDWGTPQYRMWAAGLRSVEAYRAAYASEGATLGPDDWRKRKMIGEREPELPKGIWETPTEENA